jgi:hypothetical protein
MNRVNASSLLHIGQPIILGKTMAQKHFGRDIHYYPMCFEPMTRAQPPAGNRVHRSVRRDLVQSRSTALVILRHARRRLVSINVTNHPTA